MTRVWLNISISLLSDLSSHCNSLEWSSRNSSKSMKLTRGQLISLFSTSDPHTFLYHNKSISSPRERRHCFEATGRKLNSYLSNTFKGFNLIFHKDLSHQLAFLSFGSPPTFKWPSCTSEREVAINPIPSTHRRRMSFPVIALEGASNCGVAGLHLTSDDEAAMYQWAGSQPFTIWIRVGQL